MGYKYYFSDGTFATIYDFSEMDEEAIEEYNRQAALESECVMELIDIKNQLSTMGNENEPSRAVLIERRQRLHAQVQGIQVLLRMCQISYVIQEPNSFAG